MAKGHPTMIPNSSNIEEEEEFSQSAITCSKLTIETLEQGLKYVQS